MTIEIPQYGLKAYALLFSKHGVKERFRQSELDWIVSSSMKKKIFALLLRAGWIKKTPHQTYSCISPAEAIKGLLAFRVPQTMEKAEKKYAFTQLSAVEIWSDFVYVQRGLEKSPYFIKVLRKDVAYWKKFFSVNEITCYIRSGTTVGEYVVLIPVQNFSVVKKNGFNVDSVEESIKYAKVHETYDYALNYIWKKYGVLK